MKGCNDIHVEATAQGFVRTSPTWPGTILVDRTLADYPQPFVAFGRRNVLRFNCLNGSAVYNRTEDTATGWKYRLVESSPDKALDIGSGGPTGTTGLA